MFMVVVLWGGGQAGDMKTSGRQASGCLIRANL